jgi:hypothetical protein
MAKPYSQDLRERTEHVLKKVAPAFSIRALSITCRIEAMGRGVAPGLVLMPECLAKVPPWVDWAGRRFVLI